MANKNYERLVEMVREINYLGQVMSLLRWDQETYMPKGALKDRAQQLALMSGIVHKRKTSRAMDKLLRSLKRSKSLTRDQRIMVREVSRDHKRATALPSSLVKEISRTETFSMEAWVKARKDKDFKRFRPWLEKITALKLKSAEKIGYEDRPYDALLDEYEPNMRTRDVDEILTRFRKKLVPLVSKIAKASTDAKVDDSILKRKFAIDKQKAFFSRLVADLGYSFDTGRMDITTHPFTSGMASDVRITTRFNERDIRPALFACIHEAGHGIYEQGTMSKHHHTPLGMSESLGIHESQSRLYENIIGRGESFWRYYLPRIKKVFPTLKKVRSKEWMKAINMVVPSFVRVEADEVTYNLHILLRFELEKEITEGEVDIGDIPSIWNERMDKYLGIVPPDDALGCLQDIHWSFGLMGYFPTYTLGNLLSVQIYDRAKKDIRGLESGMASGDFSGILQWLRKKVHRQGRRYNYQDLAKRATGSYVDEDNFLRYIKRKYGRLFQTRF